MVLRFDRVGPRDPGSGIRDPGCGIRGAGSGIRFEPGRTLSCYPSSASTAVQRLTVTGRKDCNVARRRTARKGQHRTWLKFLVFATSMPGMPQWISSSPHMTCAEPSHVMSDTDSLGKCSAPRPRSLRTSRKVMPRAQAFATATTYELRLDPSRSLQPRSR